MNCIKSPTLNYNLTLSLLPKFGIFFTLLFSYTVVSFIIFVLSPLSFILLNIPLGVLSLFFLSLFKTFLCLLSILTPIQISVYPKNNKKRCPSQKNHNPVIARRRKFLYQKIMVFKVRPLL